MSFSPIIDELIKALRVLPGVGNKSAQRMAFSLLERNREGALRLAELLELAMHSVKNCRQCRTFTESDICGICHNPARVESAQICVVESPQDVVAVESTANYRGQYFVLMGHLSPIDGIGPKELHLDVFEERLKRDGIKEVILATNPTVEGEATAHYISQLCDKYHVEATRIAHGVPVGGELEFIDGSTLTHAFNGRRKF